MTLQDYTTEEHHPIEAGVHLMRPEQMSRTTGIEKIGRNRTKQRLSAVRE